MSCWLFTEYYEFKGKLKETIDSLIIYQHSNLNYRIQGHFLSLLSEAARQLASRTECLKNEEGIQFSGSAARQSHWVFQERGVVGEMVQNSRSLYAFTFNVLIAIHEYIYSHSTTEFTF